MLVTCNTELEAQVTGMIHQVGGTAADIRHRMRSGNVINAQTELGTGISADGVQPCHLLFVILSKVGHLTIVIGIVLDLPVTFVFTGIQNHGIQRTIGEVEVVFTGFRGEVLTEHRSVLTTALMVASDIDHRSLSTGAVGNRSHDIEQHNNIALIVQRANRIAAEHDQVRSFELLCNLLGPIHLLMHVCKHQQIKITGASIIGLQGDRTCRHSCSIIGGCPAMAGNLLGIDRVAIALQMLMRNFYHMDRITGTNDTVSLVVHRIAFTLIVIGDISCSFKGSCPDYGIAIAHLVNTRQRRKITGIAH